MAEWARNTPWRQGHVLPADALNVLGLKHPDSPDDTIAVVISHDCDLANAPDQEPEVEIIVGRQIGKADGNFTYAKNARKLHLDFRNGDTLVTVEIVASAKMSLPKHRLADYQPQGNLRLDPQIHSVLQRWLAARYRRSAFPDEFDNRLNDSGLREKLGKIIKPSGSYIPAVFFDIDNGEEVARNGSDDTYTLDVIILYTTANNEEKARAVAEEAAQAIGSAFKATLYTNEKGWQYIELRDCRAISDQALTYRQSTLLKQWRLEHISLSKKPNQPMI